jgi:hypothetical protein
MALFAFAVNVIMSLGFVIDTHTLNKLERLSQETFSGKLKRLSLKLKGSL